MNKQIEALKMAIEALEEGFGTLECEGMLPHRYQETIQVCKKALAEAENQEIGDYEIKAMLDDIEWYQQEQRKLIDRIKELEKKEWQSLSDDEINEYWYQSNNDVEGVSLGFTTQQHYFARAIEQALKELNAKK